MNTYQNQSTFTVPEQYRGHNTLWRPQSIEDMNELTQDACGIGSAGMLANSTDTQTKASLKQ